MKFGKSLSTQIEETLPEWRDKFLSYKELKKRLKLIEPPNYSPTLKDAQAQAQDDGEEELNIIRRAQKRRRVLDHDDDEEEVDDFVKLLEDEVEKFNTFFVEKEEEYIIKLKDLQDRVNRASDKKDEIIKIRKDIVNIHGEMVLLENYSALNYTGLVKILKKYDKRTGALLRLPFIQKVLHQPFFTTDLLYKLVKECESMLDHLSPVNVAPNENEPSTSCESLFKESKELAGIECIESLHMKSTIAALRVLREIRSGSSTVNAFSLPPLQTSGIEDDKWTKVPVLEQAAK